MFQVQDTREQWSRKHHVTPKQVLGHFAMWAVRQTPYFPSPPENLQQVLSKLNELFTARCEEVIPGNFYIAHVSMRELDTMLRALVEYIPEVMAWNERKNGKQGNAFCSRYDKPEPDDDFIDLDALTRNTAMSVMLEEERSEYLDGGARATTSTGDDAASGMPSDPIAPLSPPEALPQYPVTSDPPPEE